MFKGEYEGKLEFPEGLGFVWGRSSNKKNLPGRWYGSFLEQHNGFY